MDADCLIKITRAGYKESALRAFKVDIPEPVVQEVWPKAPATPRPN